MVSLVVGEKYLQAGETILGAVCNGTDTSVEVHTGPPGDS